ncbi:hypothetical protein [Caproicibacterium amylolyticum]|uniref:Uncharacterized protein n=1 Tax=Caproicibacterium amylolyticum TaxID=2766537 RepID=A0A7G9WG85_9FIRM|nr:hypothetical protein [Caproicibacterium amylolyticum]QNO17697.1 hypothetical protein H6X83_12330 [Caproicibacterium amylolyticum]
MQAGRISSISGTTAVVIPDLNPEAVTLPLVIPWHLRGNYGGMCAGMRVFYDTCADGSGVVLARADGEHGAGWNSILGSDAS